ncbi:NADAR family protein [Paenibacillus pabuli]|uniref:NADAR family protein n=1 Tax=Paenibacillus pabuli TaxID=1472 RepID=UPI00324222A0
MEKYTFFWGKQDVFSQWHPAVFVHEGEEFTCAEQAMMYRKAILFGDTAVAQELLTVSHPSAHKQLGRKVRNFDDKVWNKHREQIVYDINLDKFTQNPKMLAALMQTKGTKLAEASPYDKIWGIGFKSSDPRAKDSAKWTGLNLLGKALTRLRDNLENSASAEAN